MSQKRPKRPSPTPIPEWFPRGTALLRDPSLNKGSSFTAKERDALGLRGLLPPLVANQDEQVARILENFERLHTPLSKYILIEALHDRNEALFYRIIIDYPDEMMPIIYTPTVGLACQQFGHIYRRPRGLFISADDRGRVAQLMRNWPHNDTAMIVVTDGERILGLGDLGANGMGIPIGKLALYTACAGVHPSRCLPIMLDVGTNNEALLNDPLYLGIRQKRLTGQAYDDFVEEFMAAAQDVFPDAVVQFEDFANHNAYRLLKSFRGRARCFNDDIQGTAAVTVAGIFSALRVTNKPMSEQRFLCLGAGGAATGISGQLTTAMVEDGLDLAAARRRCWMVDSKGLVVASRTGLTEQKLPFAHDHPHVVDFLGAVKAVKPTAIIGVGAMPGMFDRDVIEEMTRLNERPIIFSLSNPTSKSECSAQQAYEWSGGRALFASGSPFDPVDFGGQHFVPRQGNNSYIFPGVGLGAIAVRSSRITDDMFVVAARALAAHVKDSDLAQGSLYPPLREVREVSARIAVAVAEVAFRDGLADIERPDDLLAFIRQQMYQPTYPIYAV
jgi:malate dehydrogenase (oxaloacetate-decarboxylating)(NADP+)